MTKFKKALIGTAAASAMAVSATPAVANEYGHGYHKKTKIDAGDVIAGAVIIGGLAAILSSGKKKRHYDRNYHHGGYKGGGYGYDNAGYGYKGKRIRPRRAVQRCINAAERKASHYGYADVTEIRDVDRTRYGWKVRGRIVVKNSYGNYKSSYGYGRNKRHSNYASYDRGRFTCYIEGRRISDLRLRGLGNYR